MTHRSTGSLALPAARESMVLLKNQDGVLPLKSSIKTIAVIGPNAESLAALEGNYNGTPSHPVYPLDGIRKLFAGKAKVALRPGLSLCGAVAGARAFHACFMPEAGASAPGLKANTSPTRTFPASRC